MHVGSQETPTIANLSVLHKPRNNMQLSKNLIERFQTLHLIKFGVDISYDSAEQQLKELAELVRLTTREKEEKDARTINN